MPETKVSRAARTKTEKTIKKEVAPKAAKPAVKTAKVEATVETKAAAPKKSGGLSVPMYSFNGQVAGNFDLPAEIFGAKVNVALLSQALRVYLNNLKAHWGNTKTRGEVQGSTHKIYKQKGTGGARHGSKRAPIFVHGGIAMGPKYRKVTLDLPQKMRRAALISALSQKAADNRVMVVDLSKSTGKTKEMAALVKALNLKSVLLVDGEMGVSARGAQNLAKFNVVTANNLSAYDAIKHHSLLLTQAAVTKLQERMNGVKGEKNA